MIFLKNFRKTASVLANISILLNSFLPLLLVSRPVYATDLSSLNININYFSSSNSLDISSGQTLSYQLFYTASGEINSISGDNLNQSNQNHAFYLGTCSTTDCVPQKIDRGILKTKDSSNQFLSIYFSVKDNILTVDKQLESNQLDLTQEENNFLDNKSNWTFENVQLNQEYIAPQNSGVKIIFTKLPPTSGNIKIEEITLTDDQVIQTGALSNKAYDITSDMVDGTFEYTLSLPVPDFVDKNKVDIKYTEEVSGLNSSQKVDQISTSNNSVSAQNLNHFTVFFAVIKTTDKNLVEKEIFKKGETIYINTAVVDVAKTKIRIKDPNGAVIKTFNETISPVYQYNYTIKSSDTIGKYTIDIGSYQITSFSLSGIKWGWVWKNNIDNFDIVEGICNDGIKDPNEDCDAGSQNGIQCFPNFKETCNYCDNLCQNIEVTNIDTTKPIVSINTTASNKTINIYGTVTESNPDHYWLAIYRKSDGKQIYSSVVYHSDQFINKLLYTWDTSALSSGDYQIKFAERDAVNNRSDDFVSNISIDNTPPSKPNEIGFKNPDLLCGSVTNQKIVTVDWSDSTDNNRVVGYDYSIDYPNGNTRGKWNTFFTQSQYRGSLNEGIHYIQVRSKDAAGNTSDWTNSCSITYDSISPTSSIFTPTESQYFSNQINITGNTSDTNSIASVNLSFSQFVNGNCSDVYTPITTISGDSSPSFDWSYFWTPETEGSYCIKAAGTDIAGNIEHSAIVKNIIFDKSIPEVSILLNPSNPDASNGWYQAQPEITLINNDINLKQIQYQWNSIDNNSWSSYIKPFKLTQEGSYVLYYRATDKANNTSQVGQKIIKWDKTDLDFGPQNIYADPNPTTGSTSIIHWSSAKDNIGIDHYTIVWQLNDTNNPKSYSKTVGGGDTQTEIDQLISGHWTVKVYAYDASGRNINNAIDLTVGSVSSPSSEAVVTIPTPTQIPLVLGAQDSNQESNIQDQNDSESPSSQSSNSEGQVLGIEDKKSLFDWWWLSLLLIIPIYVIFKKVRSKRKNH